MTRIDIEFGVDRILTCLGLRSVGKGAARDMRTVEDYLALLKTAPEPDLGAGRRRLLAEAARLQAGQVRPAGVQISAAWLALSFVLTLVIGMAVIWNVEGPGNPFWGAFSTGTRISSSTPLLEASVTRTGGPAVTIDPTPIEITQTVSAAPVTTPQAAVAPAPTRGPQLTMTRTSP